MSLFKLIQSKSPFLKWRFFRLKIMENNPITNPSKDVEKTNKFEGGFLYQGRNFSNSPEQPLITVVTVTFRDKDRLLFTMQNIWQQTYKNIEYIVLDGGSKDGTLELLQEHSHRISYWRSEPDKGIYDAMNKAIQLAQGEWIYFLNAGDSFASIDVLDNIFSQKNPSYKDILSTDFIYGDCQIIYEGFSRFHHARPIYKIWQGMITPHQAIFVRTHIHRKNLFATTQAGAEFEILYRCYVQGYKFQYIPLTIAHYQAGGISDKRRAEVIWLFWKTVSHYHPYFGKKIYIFIYYLSAVGMSYIRLFLKKCLPKMVVSWIIKKKK